jgi:tetratricopeptide (TPR) repeat protein
MTPVPVNLREDPRFFEPVKNYYTTYKNLGVIYQMCNQPEKAMEAFTSALGYTSSYFSKHYAASVKVLLASLMDQAGRLEDAAVLLKEARPFSDNPAMVDYRLATVLQRLDNSKEAELYVQRAIMKDDGRNR